MVISSRLSFVWFLPVAFVAVACGDDKVATTDTRDAAADVTFDDTPIAETVADVTSDTRVDATTTTDTTAPDSTPSDTRADATTTPDTTEPADTTVADSKADTTEPADTSEPADTAVADTAEPADTTVADTATTDTATDTSTATDTNATCTKNGYTSVAADALKFDNGDLWYLAQSNAGAPVDVLSIEIYAALGGATAPGSYDLTDDNYDACGNCVLVQTACDQDLNNCERTFLAQSGKLEVSAVGDIGDQFTATLTDVVLIEITYDADYHSTPVPGGASWCVDRYDLDVTLQ